MAVSASSSSVVCCRPGDYVPIQTMDWVVSMQKGMSFALKIIFDTQANLARFLALEATLKKGAPKISGIEPRGSKEVYVRVSEVTEAAMKDVLNAMAKTFGCMTTRSLVSPCSWAKIDDHKGDH